MEKATNTGVKMNKNVAIGLTAVFVTYFASNFYAYWLNVAMPKMAAQLDGMALYSWGISLPALASAFVTLLFGKLSDMYGRRIILTIAMLFFLAGSVITAISQTFEVNILGRVVIALGQGAIAPLCFSVIGDLFPPAERSKWSGWLNFPAALTAFLAPTIGGIITDQATWRILFWINVPLLVISASLIMFGVPSLTQKAAHKIDILGSVLLAVASGSMILAFSWGGTTYPWLSIQIIGLLAFSIAVWAAFIATEGKAAEPILEPQVLTNRTFMTAAIAGFMSFFGLLGVMVYFPLFLQGVQGLSATVSGQMVTPFNIFMTFMGIPAGIMLGKTKRYKWMFILGYAILTLAMFGMTSFTESTPVWLGVLVSATAGLGLGAIPTINVLVAQFSVPRRLLGVAVGAIFFFVLMGGAIAPSILGSAMNSTYASAVQVNLPAAVTASVDAATLANLQNVSFMLSPDLMSSAKTTISALDNGTVLYDQTVAGIRDALRESLRMVYLIGAITMVVSFLLILTIPEISLDAEAEDKKAALSESESAV